MGCSSTQVISESDIKELKKCKSRNSMNLDRLQYFGHLLGGMQSVIHSRFFTRRPRPFTFSHMVTSKCNCNCSFCFWKHHKENEDLSLEQIKKIYAQAKQEGFMNSILWGGEPLLRQDLQKL
jgi:uncharacterized radical SAM superfamily Fe-S cluster-containing enzyme